MNKIGKAKHAKTELLSVDEVLTRIKTEKVQAAFTVGVQPTLLEYLTQMGGKHGRSTFARQNIIDNIRRKHEEAEERKAVAEFKREA